MGIGIFLIAVGAVLTFAENANAGGLSLDAMGWILVIVLLGVLAGAAVWGRRSQPGGRRGPNHPSESRPRRATLDRAGRGEGTEGDSRVERRGT